MKTKITTTEDVRRWWDRRPCNVRHSRHPRGSLEYSREVTHRRLLAEPHELQLMEPGRWRDELVLEVGCGIGTASMIFAQHGARVIGIDLSPLSLSLARQRREVEGFDDDQLVFFMHDVEEPLTGFGFVPDLIYSYGVLHHTPHPDVALRNLRAIADYATELRIMFYHRWSLKGLRLGLTDKRIARQSEAEAHCPITRAYSRRSARRLLEANGWRVRRIWVDHVFKYRWQDWANGDAVVSLPWRILPDMVYDVIAKTLGWHVLIIAEPGEIS